MTPRQRKRRQQIISVLATVLGLVFGVVVMLIIAFGYRPWSSSEDVAAQEPERKIPAEFGIFDYAPADETVGMNGFDIGPRAGL